MRAMMHLKEIHSNKSATQKESPDFCNEQERLCWIKQQLEQVTTKAVARFRNRLFATRKSCNANEPTTQQLNEEE